MAEYPLLALTVIIAAVLFDAALKTKIIFSRSFYLTLAALTVMTLIATQFLDGLPIVEYNHQNTLAVRLGYMPIEDLSYTIAACIITPAVWRKLHE
ncbi:TPA: hypothetical protein EYO12_00970 [Candidatus Saccharibacteria bacterium]|nr:hypothetical protein [Candidatus Saccharibacteria bacterium]HIO87290.1 hypothetical protein [Candidatus Saccharibacteria bacterium]